MISKTGKDFDIILISGEYYDDHPLSPVGVIARVLESQGYKIGIIEKPLEKQDFIKLGKPKLFFGISSGSIDSMLNNYTALNRARADDKNFDETFEPLPDRAIIFYSNKIKEYFKDSKIILGGIEASLRRFAHYDFWSNKLRGSIIFDTRADALVYGNGEMQIIEIADRIKNNQSLEGIKGICIISKTIPENFQKLPSFEEIKNSKEKFCEMQLLLSNTKNLYQEHNKRYVLQYESPEYTTEYLDWIYSLPFSRKLNKNSFLKMAEFSVVTHRGCIGKCSFCSISLHQGDKIISRSEKSILDEIKKLTKHENFKGYIDDLGGPSANMYGMDCINKVKCNQSCLNCKVLNKSHNKLISLLKKARQIPGVKKVFIRSGIRYDLALNSEEYIKEISLHHISGCLKIAPEHFSPNVINLMNKNNKDFEKFVKLFNSINKNNNQDLRYYMMICHPGETKKEILELREKIKQLNNFEQFQIFTPTPMTMSTCMYYTELNPYTLKKINLVKDFTTKKLHRDLLLREIQQKKNF
jgi:uncharacterized radical SAM protein YgiQ